MFVGLQAKLYTVGAAIIGVLFLMLRIEGLKNKNKKLTTVAETLKARQHVERVQKKIKREEKKRLVSRKADIVNQLKKKREEFEGLDNLNNPDDF